MSVALVEGQTFAITHRHIGVKLNGADCPCPGAVEVDNCRSSGIGADSSGCVGAAVNRVVLRRVEAADVGDFDQARGYRRAGNRIGRSDNAAYRLTVARIHIDVVGQHIAGGRGRSGVTGCRFLHRVEISHGHGGIVATLDGDHQRIAYRQPRGITNAVGKCLVQGPVAQCLYGRGAVIGLVAVGAVGADAQRAVKAGDLSGAVGGNDGGADAGEGQTVAVRIADPVE